MKSAQIIGLFCATLGLWYLSIFYEDIAVNSSSSPSLGLGLGFGVAVVFALFIVSFCLMVPTFIMLRTSKARIKYQFTGCFWTGLLVLNVFIASLCILLIIRCF